MASAFDFGEKAILDWILGGTSPTRPTQRNVALFTTLPDETGAGGIEVSTGVWTNYARVNAAFGAAAGASPSTASNSGVTDFGTAATTGNVTALGFGIYDQAGNPWLGPFAFATPVIVQNGNPIYFPIGTLIATCD